MSRSFSCLVAAWISITTLVCGHSLGQDRATTPSREAEPVLTFPPTLPGGKKFVSVYTQELLDGPAHLAADVIVAKEPPTIDFTYFPGQTYEGHPWSNWGDSCVAGGKYYASIGDHLAPRGNAYVYEYDAAAKSFRLLADVAKTLKLPDGHYVPGKIHTQLGMGEDGWLYFGTHRGGTRVTSDENHYRGDWIMRCHPQTAVCEIVSLNPVSKHCIPTAIVDGPRMMFYGSTAAGSDAEITGTQFFAYDLRGKRAIYSGPDGPARAMVLSQSTGRVYYTPGNDDAPLMRFDPATDSEPKAITGKMGIRAASQETADGFVYTVSSGRGDGEPMLFRFDTKTEVIETLGSAAVGGENYITTLDVDESGRFLYYLPGAHGGGYRDGSPIVQYDTQKRKKKVIAFLEPYFSDTFSCSLKGTYSAAISNAGDTLFVTWNASRGSKNWDCCALTVIHIPVAERR